MDDLLRETMRSHYRRIGTQRSHAGRCAMDIPSSIAGKRVLDVCCRKGKGAFELSDYTGEEGFVLGVDPDATNMDSARTHASENHWAGNRWSSYLRFCQAWPEDLSCAGVLDRSFDVVYINSALNLCWDLQLALAEFHRVLAPGGRLWVAEGIFSAGGGVSPEPSTESNAGDVFLAALSCDAFKDACLEAGFTSVSFGLAVAVPPDNAVRCVSSSPLEFICRSVCATA